MEEFFSSFLRRAGMPASAGLSCYISYPDVMHILPRLPRRASPTTSYGLGCSVLGNMGVVYRLLSSDRIWNAKIRILP